MDAEPILHLAIAGEWEEARRAGEPYRRSTVGISLAEQGFIHCSFPHQAQQVADAFYAGRDDVILLVIDPRRLTAELRVEPATDRDGEEFPHIHGPLDLDAVLATIPLPLGPDGRLGVSAAIAHAKPRTEP